MKLKTIASAAALAVILVSSAGFIDFNSFSNTSVNENLLVLSDAGNDCGFDFQNAAWIEYTADCVISFESNGLCVDEQTVECGSFLSEPSDPVLNGHMFAGWYCDILLTAPYDFSSPVYTDFILYAKWIPYEIFDDEVTSFVLIDASAVEGVDFIEIDKARLESVMQEMISSEIERLNLLLPLGTFCLDAAAFSGILENMGDSVSFTIRRADPSDLTSEQSEAVGSMTVYDINVVSDGKRITSFDSKIEVAVKYDLAEEGSNMYVLHVDDSGKTERIDAAYDGRHVIFETDHTSYFAVSCEGTSADKTAYYVLAALIVFAFIMVYIICRYF